LVEDGLVKLDDPVSKYVRFPDKVRQRGITEKVATVPTLRHLLGMMAGLKYGNARAYAKILADVERRSIKDLGSFCDALAEVPLHSQPGAAHLYSFSADVIGRVCEVVSGQRLDIFVKKKIFDPLGMKDTHFVVPPAKRKRLAKQYECKKVPKGSRWRDGPSFKLHRWRGATSHPGLLSGGGGILGYAEAGIWSTAQDYARFCQMLLDGGLAPGGRRVLRAATMRMLWCDGLAPFMKKDGRVDGWSDFGGEEELKEDPLYWDHHAWSLLNTTLDLEKGDRPRKLGPPRKGHAMCMYGQGAYWFVDAQRKLVVVSFSQFWGGKKGDAGCEALPFAKAAVDEGRPAKKHKL
jgi:CubicO group peptidase (beta-lactamase class C family)